jgi:hypothetical protein
MNPLYSAILHGNPPALPSNVEQRRFTYVNHTDIGLDIMLVASNPHHGAMQLNRLGGVKAHGRSEPLEASTPAFVAAFSSDTGAFFAAARIEAAAEIAWHCDMIARPNDIGAPPAPSVRGPIPVNSARVVVACARAAGSTLIREQFWYRTADSYSLAPKERRTTSMHVTTGIERSSSSQEDLSASLDLSAGLSWGPISASLTASFAATSSTLQSVQLFEQRSVRSMDSVYNASDHDDMTVLQWQLMDVVNVFRDGKLAASVMSAQLPTLTRTHLVRAV